MRNGATIAVIIPAFNEERSIARVIYAVPNWVDDIVVVDNGSTDSTAETARKTRARVVSEPRRGYGSACLAGIAALNTPHVVVFLDGDFSDHPEEMDLLVDPIVKNEVDLMIGSRALGQCEAGALAPQVRFGNWLACGLIRLFWRFRFTDLGPFRAIRYSALKRLRMCDRNYGWTVEMQIRAIRKHLPIREAPVSYRKRIGQSKISGTLKGIVGAGTKIIGVTLFLGVGYLLSSCFGKMNDGGLLIFTRYPESGKTKTRLIPKLGARRAMELHKEMTVDTLHTALRFTQRYATSLEVHYEGGRETLMRTWLGSDLRYQHQTAGTLGKRMYTAFEKSFQNGIRRVVIVGTDCPGVTVDILKRAFDELRRADVVLGPANDGGYYLIGLRRPIPQLFTDIPWGTGKVLEKTEWIARERGLTVVRLDWLDDVDRPEDLPVWEKTKLSVTPDKSKIQISVIIPTLNEAENIRKLLPGIRDIPAVEIIVVDGGSKDETLNVARSYGVKALTCFPGRAKQMNTGAAVAKGQILLFLHADTCLPESYDEHIFRVMAESDVVAGAFEFALDWPSWGLRFIERATNWRSRAWQMPYGDQAIFVRANVFHAVAGFPEIPIMEDVELVRKLRRRGRVVTASVPAVTSARRWLRLGVWRTTAINQVCLIAYHLGVSPTRIARWYSAKP